MAELVDALDLGSSAARRGGSSPLIRTTHLAGRAPQAATWADRHTACGQLPSIASHRYSSCFVLFLRYSLGMGETKGRGARSNATGRYEPQKVHDFDDGWTAHDAGVAPLRTRLTPERARTIIARNQSPDIGFDRSINPYKGCEHGCV